MEISNEKRRENPSCEFSAAFDFRCDEWTVRSKESDLWGKALDGIKTQAGSIGNRLGRDTGTKKVNRI